MSGKVLKFGTNQLLFHFNAEDANLSIYRVECSQISFLAGQQILNLEKSHRGRQITSKRLVGEPTIRAKQLGSLQWQVGVIVLPVAWGLRPSSAIYQL